MNSIAAPVRRNYGPAREAASSGLIWTGCLAVVAATLQHTTALPPRSLPVVVGTFALVLVVVLMFLPRHHPHRRFGAANRVTLSRTAMATLLLGCVGAGVQPLLAWFVVGIATLAACLDALDGPLARRYGTASVFGARFDMEADAGLIMVLSLLAWQFEKAGPWILAAGLMRYVFMVAGRWLPCLRAELPPSVRRQSMCVLQVLTLIACLTPVVPMPWSAGLAALGLTALSASFLIDIAWLTSAARRAHRE